MNDLNNDKGIVTKPAKFQGSKYFYGNTIILCSFIVVFITSGLNYCFGVFFKPLLADFGWSRALTSGAYSLFLIITGISGIFAGNLSGRFGPRVVVSICGLLMGLSYLLMSQINAVWQLYVFYGLLASIGQSGFWIPLLSTVARWYLRRRGLMTGIMAAGVGFGMMALPLLITQLILKYGWRTTFIIAGGTSLVLILIPAQFIKRDPHLVGQQIYGNSGVETQSPYMGLYGFSLREIVRTSQFWMLSTIYFLFGICLYTIMVHIVPHAIDIGISATNAAAIISIIGASSIVSKIGIGSLGDKITNKPAIVIVIVAMFISFLWLLFAKGQWGFYLFAVIFSIGYGGLITVESPIVAELFGLKSHGVIIGIIVLALNCGSAAGTFLAGQIFDMTGSYDLAFRICVVVSFIAIMAALLIKPTHIQANLP